MKKGKSGSNLKTHEDRPTALCVGGVASGQKRLSNQHRSSDCLRWTGVGGFSCWRKRERWSRQSRNGTRPRPSSTHQSSRQFGCTGDIFEVAFPRGVVVSARLFGRKSRLRELLPATFAQVF